MTIVIVFQSSAYRTFKDYYIQQVIPNLRSYFPELVSYNRFVELQQTALMPLLYYLYTRKGKATEISFIDSTPIEVCHPKRDSLARGVGVRAKILCVELTLFYKAKEV